ncbi:MAG TPA: LacI family DNA-binding transcriptional regulator [Verrucomicrobiae bacterium]
MPETRPTLQDVARAAGVSPMTASRALRNAPKVSAEKRERVLQTAAALNYQPDPHISRLMGLVRDRKRTRIRAAMAVLREDVPKDELLNPSYQYVPLEDIRHRAGAFGYHVEEFWLGRDGLTPERVQRILRARGIEAVIVSPQSAQLPCAKIDYSPFAAVAFGCALRQPMLHRCFTDMNLGIQMAAGELHHRGYQRIGVAITRWIDDRSQNGYSGGMFHFQQELPARQRVPVLLFPHNNLARNFSAFSDWMKAHRPDALISFDTHLPAWLKRLGLRVPEDVGFVVHDWSPRMSGCAGLHHRRDHIAAAAVDLVITQLSRHEHGVPAVPRQIMIPPEWVEGPSVRPPAD